ncbi:MAG TPA: sigma-70 family RNA polymerase sigma factor [Candidatus Limnocylindria bacterium]|nr:sigma-70 family RNA polymerase sigma factor [Candidatus Limnocylindria bacterium]
MTVTDLVFTAVQTGDGEAFAEWMGRVERSIRSSLRAFSRTVDVEVVLQETFMRMWILAADPSRRWDGENASLRFALRVARNVALEEVRRARLGRFVPIDALDPVPEIPVEPESTSDPALRQAIEECFERVPPRPREALAARLEHGHEAPDRDLAQRLGMTLNTFLQNIVRARQSLARCLARKGIEVEGMAS